MKCSVTNFYEFDLVEAQLDAPSITSLASRGLGGAAIPNRVNDGAVQNKLKQGLISPTSMRRQLYCARGR